MTTRTDSRPPRARGALTLLLSALASLSLVVAPPEVAAQGAAPTEGRQLAFVGARVPAGSLNGVGMDSTQVVLRWQVIEGELPPDVAALRLLRDDVEIYRRTRGTVSTAAEINARYARPENARRRLEMAAIVRDDPQPGDTADLGTSLAGRLRAAVISEGPRLWASRAAQRDVVVAEAWGEAYVDRRVAEAAAPRYRLEAVDAAGNTARLGEVQIVARDVTRPGPVGDLQQIVDLGRCDAPERGRVHGVVALDWASPGEHPGEQFAQSLFIAGYDIWRAREPEGDVVPRDLAALARAGRYDRDGNLSIAGLTQVNRHPIVASGRPEIGSDGRRVDDRLRGHNAAFAQWAQTASEARAQGLLPGDTRTWYVVARDLNGNYGPTRALRVTVPDALPPPAPWDVRAVPRQRTGLRAELELRWPAIDVRNVQQSREDGRVWCNLDTAAIEGRLRHAPDAAACAGAPLSINADVEGYLVYRFDDPLAASAFADTDGDGYDDADERVALASVGPDFTGPGTSCDPDLHPAGITPVLPEHISAADAEWAGGRRVMRFVDDLPAIDRERVYWYRVAAVGRNGQIGPMGPMARAHFPSYDKPLRPDADAVQLAACEPFAELAPSPVDGYVAIDELGEARAARFTCVYPAGGQGGGVGDPSHYTPPVAPGGGVENIRTIGTFAMDSGPGGSQRLQSKVPCGTASQGGTCRLLVEFLDEAGGRLSAVTVPPEQVANPDSGQCSFTVIRKQDCGEATTPLVMGQAVEGDLLLFTLDPALGQCVDLYLDEGSPATRLTTICPETPRFEWHIPGMSAQTVCLRYSVLDADNQGSTMVALPCVRTTGSGRVPPPSIVEVAFDPSGDLLRWRAPEAPTAGILVEWWRTGGAEVQRGSTYLGHQGAFGYDHIHSARLHLPPLGDAPETWCVRARTVAASSTTGGSAVSYTSAQWCGRRAPPAEPLPVYLPWPETPAPIAHAELLPIRLLPFDGVPAILLSRPDGAALSANGCNLDAIGLNCNGEVPCVRELQARVEDSCDLCGAVRNAESPHSRYVVYRQSRAADGGISDFHQVTPLIDHAFCQRSCQLPARCTENAPRACGPGDSVCTDTFFDPYLQLLRFAPGDAWPQQVLAFVDRTPMVEGGTYRYQFVYFDPLGEVAARRSTDWVSLEVRP